MKLKRFLAGFAAAALAVSTIATVGAETQTLTKEIYKAGTDDNKTYAIEVVYDNIAVDVNAFLGTAASGANSVFAIEVPAIINGEDSRGRMDADYYVDFSTLKVNGTKLFADKNAVKIDSSKGVKIAMVVSDLSKGGAGTVKYADADAAKVIKNTASSPAAIDLSTAAIGMDKATDATIPARSINKSGVTVTAELIPVNEKDADTKRLAEEITKIEFDSNFKFYAALSNTARLYTADGVTTYTAENTVAKAFDDVKNKSKVEKEFNEDYENEFRWTKAEVAAALTAGAEFELVVNLSDKIPYYSAYPYFEIKLQSHTWGGESTKKISSEKATISKGDKSVTIPVTLADIYNDTYYIEENQWINTATVDCVDFYEDTEVYVESIDLVIKYDEAAGSTNESTDLADAGEEADPTIDDGEIEIDDGAEVEDGGDVIEAGDDVVDAGNTADSNPETGIALAIVPAALAAAGVVVSRKRK